MVHDENAGAGFVSGRKVAEVAELNLVGEARGDATSESLTLCDVEPIHIPGSIQPHGLLLIAEASTLKVIAGAGAIETRLSVDWIERPLTEILAVDLSESTLENDPSISTFHLGQVHGISEVFDVSLHRSGNLVLIELELAAHVPASSGAILSLLDSMASSFGRSPDLQTLCEKAASAFRRVTGFDRVMIYRFLDDDAGTVVAEAQAPELRSFLNHHFPASDIPKQARALYVRNRVRVIPDVHYLPAPLRPADAGFEGTDMSDLSLRSVSPIHIEYLKNIGVGASASVSIVRDGVLWGLIACHNETPRRLTYEVRAACRSLAGSLSLQIRSKEEAVNFRERIRLRSAEDVIVAHLDREGPLDEPFPETRNDMQRLLDADGFASVRGELVELAGRCPSIDQIRDLAAWVHKQTSSEPYNTSQLGEVFAPAKSCREVASGLLAVTLSVEDPSMFMWFRAEELEVINWAGNPHKDVAHDPLAVLNPRSSFEAWSESVRGKARPWTLGECEAAVRLRNAVFEARQNRRLREVNRELAATLADKESLLRQKDYLVKEVNHRVQNSLQLVSAFLSMQARAIDDEAVVTHLNEAQRRLAAVALVHKRLYRDDNVEAIDLGRYLEDICLEMRQSMGTEWHAKFVFELAPFLISTDRAVNLGLVLTELIINAQKYAYAGKAGPIAVRLEQHRARFRLIVADHGVGGHVPGKGFGTRMMNAMVDRLAGTIEYINEEPGLRVVVDAPIGETLT
jgi:chemotaxis family two-component system sensor kinase Cph1